MNRRRWLVCLGGTSLALLVLAAVSFRAWDGGPIRFENFEKIHVGMTQAEVVALLGCEKGIHSTGPVYVKEPLPDGSLRFAQIPVDDERLIAGFSNNGLGVTWTWIGDRGAIAVLFDPEKKVASKEMLRGRRSMPSAWWQFLERKLGLDPE